MQSKLLALAPNLVPEPESPPHFPHTPLALPVPWIPVLIHYPFPGFSELKKSKCNYRVYDAIICFILFNQEAKENKVAYWTLSGQEIAWSVTQAEEIRRQFPRDCCANPKSEALTTLL